MSVKFTDNSVKVRNNLESAVQSFLYEAGGELQAQIIRNSRTDTGQTKGSYKYKVIKDSNEMTVYVGSDYENAIWEEFGTGEYALNGDGRKGKWVYQSKKDDNFYTTTGKKPNRPMYKAFNSLKSKLKNRLKSVLKNL